MTEADATSTTPTTTESGSAPTPFETSYREALHKHLSAPDEHTLAQAYEIGRRAVADEIGLLSLVALHHREMAEWGADEQSIANGNEFLQESLGTLEMTQRGYAAAQARAAAEQVRVAILAALAEAQLAISRRRTLANRVDELRRQAIALVGAKDGDVQLGDTCQTPQSPGWLSVPIAAGGRNIGLLSVYEPSPATVGTKIDEVAPAMLQQLAGMAAAAIEDARRYEHEHEMAVNLQRDLLPGELPDIAGIELAVRYVPADIAAGIEVGGDWYDGFELQPGCVALSVGDVSGHGIRQAALMSSLRLGIRAYAIDSESPSEVVERVDRLLQVLDPSHIATAVYLVLDVEHRKLTITNAGHPPVLAIDPEGNAAFVEAATGLALGIESSIPRASNPPIELRSGTRLLLYTDGLIDQHERRGIDGLGLLVSATDGFDGSADELCDHVLENMLEGTSSDDICLLSVRVL